MSGPPTRAGDTTTRRTDAPDEGRSRAGQGAQGQPYHQQQQQQQPSQPAAAGPGATGGAGRTREWVRWSEEQRQDWHRWFLWLLQTRGYYWRSPDGSEEQYKMAALAKASGVPLYNIQRYVTQGSRPEAPQAIALARTLGLSGPEAVGFLFRAGHIPAQMYEDLVGGGRIPSVVEAREMLAEAEALGAVPGFERMAARHRARAEQLIRYHRELAASFGLNLDEGEIGAAATEAAKRLVVADPTPVAPPVAATERAPFAPSGPAAARETAGPSPADSYAAGYGTAAPNSRELRPDEHTKGWR